jgi:hypothetical protein
MSDPENIPDALRRVTFCEHSGAAVPLDPLAPEFALSEADKAAIVVTRAGPWLTAGDWKWRELGREVQLRNKRMPHLPIDLFRTEAEVLFQALGLILSKPTPLPYRAPWRERLRMWWMRAVWNRKNARELDEHRAALLKEFANPDRSPWG